MSNLVDMGFPVGVALMLGILVGSRFGCSRSALDRQLRRDVDRKAESADAQTPMLDHIRRKVKLTDVEIDAKRKALREEARPQVELPLLAIPAPASTPQTGGTVVQMAGHRAQLRRSSR